MRFQIIRNARIDYVGEYQSCMVSKVRMIYGNRPYSEVESRVSRDRSSGRAITTSVSSSCIPRRAAHTPSPGNGGVGGVDDDDDDDDDDDGSGSGDCDLIEFLPGASVNLLQTMPWMDELPPLPPTHAAPAPPPSVASGGTARRDGLPLPPPSGADDTVVDTRPLNPARPFRCKVAGCNYDTTRKRYLGACGYNLSCAQQ